MSPFQGRQARSITHLCRQAADAVAHLLLADPFGRPPPRVLEYLLQIWPGTIPRQFARHPDLALLKSPVALLDRSVGLHTQRMHCVDPRAFAFLSRERYKHLRNIGKQAWLVLLD